MNMSRRCSCASELKRKFAQAMDGIDALLTPTTTSPAIPLEEVDQSGTPAHFTRFGNFLDLCALALPNGFTADGPADVAADRLPRL